MDHFFLQSAIKLEINKKYLELFQKSEHWKLTLNQTWEKKKQTWEKINMEARKYLLFYIVHGVLMASILEWFAIPSSSTQHIVRTLFHDPSILCDLT